MSPTGPLFWPRAKHALVNSLVAAISLSTALAAAELFARRYLNVQFGQRTEISQALFDPQLAQKTFVPDRQLGFVPGPAWAGTLGRHGYKNGAELEEITNRKTVAVLGDSLVDEGWLPRALEKKLRMPVYYAGIGGYNTLQEAHYYERYVTRAPDVLVLSFCLNDFSPSFFVVGDDQSGESYFQQNRFDPIAAANPFLFQRSALYRAFVVATVRRSALYTPEMIAENSGMVREGLTRLAVRTRAQNTELVAVVYPHFLSYDENPWMKAAHAEALRLLSELKIRHVDVTERLLSEGFNTYRKTPDDFVHPNPAGHEVAAAELLSHFGALFE